MPLYGYIYYTADHPDPSVRQCTMPVVHPQRECIGVLVKWYTDEGERGDKGG